MILAELPVQMMVTKLVVSFFTVPVLLFIPSSLPGRMTAGVDMVAGSNRFFNFSYHPLFLPLYYENNDGSVADHVETPTVKWDKQKKQAFGLLLMVISFSYK